MWVEIVKSRKVMVKYDCLHLGYINYYVHCSQPKCKYISKVLLSLFKCYQFLLCWVLVPLQCVGITFIGSKLFLNQHDFLNDVWTTTCPKILGDVHLWRQNHQMPTPKITTQYAQLEMFANHQICVVLDLVYIILTVGIAYDWFWRV